MVDVACADPRRGGGRAVFRCYVWMRIASMSVGSTADCGEVVVVFSVEASGCYGQLELVGSTSLFYQGSAGLQASISLWRAVARQAGSDWLSPEEAGPGGRCVHDDFPLRRRRDAARRAGVRAFRCLGPEEIQVSRMSRLGDGGRFRDRARGTGPELLVRTLFDSRDTCLIDSGASP